MIYNYNVFLITGGAAIGFYVLAGLNGLQPYVRSSVLRAITRRHRLFGTLSSVAALGHMFYAFYLGMFRISGSLALIGLFATGLTGALFSQSQDRRLYLLHRIAGPITAGLIVLHLIVNINW
jgi:hypothetical protein